MKKTIITSGSELAYSAVAKKRLSNVNRNGVDGPLYHVYASYFR